MIDGECYEGDSCPGNLVLESNVCKTENSTDCDSPCKECGASSLYCYSCITGVL